MSENVKVWEEDILLPTYSIGKSRKESDVPGEACLPGK